MLYAFFFVISAADCTGCNLLIHSCRRICGHIVWIFLKMLFKQAGTLKQFRQRHVDHFSVFLVGHGHRWCVPLKPHQIHKCNHVLRHILSAVLKPCEINVSDIIAKAQKPCEKILHITDRCPCNIGVNVINNTVGVGVLVANHRLKLTVISRCGVRSAFIAAIGASLTAVPIIGLHLALPCDGVLVVIPVILFAAG